MTASKTFTAPVKEEGSALGWRIVDIPFSTKAVFGTGGRVPVCGTVNGYRFRSSLFPRKEGKHFLMLNKQMQHGAGVRNLGDTVEVTIELDTEERILVVPEILQNVFDADPEIAEYFERFNQSKRKAICDWLLQPKSVEAQERRTEQLCLQLIEMKEGESTPPAALATLFARDPEAKRGWEMLPARHRTSYLWVVTTSQNPETRLKRAEKVIEMIREYMAKKSPKPVARATRSNRK